jgi:hypothetical protein
MNVEESDLTRFCIECKEFLPLHLFQPWCRRTICQAHYNERTRIGKQQSWKANPRKREANVAWQVAYTDSKKIFDQKLNITPAQVLTILESANTPTRSNVRLVPRDPREPLSMENFCLTTQKNRMDLANVWRKLKCKKTYDQFFDPEAKRPIFAVSGV